MTRWPFASASIGERLLLLLLKALSSGADIADVSVYRAEPKKGLRIQRRFTREGVHPYDEVEWERRDSAIPGESGNVFEQKGVEVPKFWSQTATNVFADELKYLMVNQYASFNSPVWFNIGVPGVPQQASACFILSVEDDMHSILD